VQIHQPCVGRSACARPQRLSRIGGGGSSIGVVLSGAGRVVSLEIRDSLIRSDDGTTPLPGDDGRGGERSF